MPLEPTPSPLLNDASPVVSPRLRLLLAVVLALFAVLGANSLYLLTISGLQWATRTNYESTFYLWMFLAHLALGLAFVVPTAGFLVMHVRKAWTHPNRQAARVGVALLGTVALLLVSGFLLLRTGVFEVRAPTARAIAYWGHVVSAFLIVWFFVLHRLAGPRIHWRVGGGWLVFTGASVAISVAWPVLMPATAPPTVGTGTHFPPSLAQTTVRGPIAPSLLMQEEYCRECHADTHAQWAVSAHRFSSFNNPAYLFSVRETRRVLQERDGHVRASRFCAACHDPVPLFAGLFDDPTFDEDHPTAQAGITCVVCHAVGDIASVRGNGAYVLDAPVYYPLTFSPNPMLREVSKQLIKARPDLHKRAFLKPLHRTAEFCSTCHKVHLPEELNRYRWLRGQNHYDSFLLSGMSGHGASSFYYPPQAVNNCQQCHMPLMASNDFGARFAESVGAPAVHDHLFPAANTALPHLLNLPPAVLKTQQDFLHNNVLRADIFAVHEEGRIDGELHAPLRPAVPTLQPGKSYLLDVVVRTLRIGHAFTQGTADSNEVWVEVTATSGGRTLGRNGALNADREVDPWAHFLNVYMIDRQGRRIDRRNVQDIFVPLYDHQIPPGAAEVIHYRLQLPDDVREAVTIEVKVWYRKFTAAYTRQFLGEQFRQNDLPMTVLATDRLVLPVAGTPGAGQPSPPASPVSVSVPEWERWNDYGIGLLRKASGGATSGSNRGELRQAAVAFAEVERLGRADGPLNLARVYLQEGRVTDAAAALRRASTMTPPPLPWVVAWLAGLVNAQLGQFDAAIANFRSIVTMDSAETRQRGFDFSRDYRVLNELGLNLFERAKQEQRNPKEQARLLEEADQWFMRTLTLDPENVTAHHNLALIASQRGERKKMAVHLSWHDEYRLDENARDQAIALARRDNPPANHAAEAVVIYDLR